MTINVHAYGLAALFIASIKMYPMEAPAALGDQKGQDVTVIFKQRLANNEDLGEQDRNLLHAALTGDVEGIAVALARGARVAARIDGTNSLHLAAMEGHDDAVQLLLDNGACINSEVDPAFGENHAHHTALSLARIKQHVSVVRVLLRYGAPFGRYDFCFDRWISDAFDKQPLVVSAILLWNADLEYFLNQDSIDSDELHEALLLAAVHNRTGGCESGLREDIVKFIFARIVSNDKNASFDTTLNWLEKLKNYYMKCDRDRFAQINSMSEFVKELIESRSNVQPSGPLRMMRVPMYGDPWSGRGPFIYYADW